MTDDLDPTGVLEPQMPPRRRGPLGSARSTFDDIVALTKRGTEMASRDGTGWRIGRNVALAAAFLLVVQLLFHQSLPDLVNGIALGSLYGIIAVAMVLMYRTLRVINFAAVAVGSVPAVVALYLDIQFHIDYVLVLPIVLVGGPLMGALTDIAVMRRFTSSPRLIVTVLTIGVAETFSLLAYFIPIWMGHSAKEISAVPTPWQNFAIHNGRGQPVITGNEVAEIAVVLVLTIGLVLFLRGTRVGLALRASAENADRAQLLGIPVRLLGTVAWMLAGLLASLAVYFQSPVIGVPQDTSLILDPSLLFALAAAVVARFNKIGLALGAGCASGILAFASVQSSGSSDVATAYMFVVILLALVFQRGGVARAFDTGVETWRALKEFRPVPAELRDLRQVKALRVAVPAALVVVAVVLGLVLGADQIPDLVVLPIYGIVAVSMVVLTGWSGQISLGQFGLAAAGALVTGGLVANHNPDFFAVLGLGIVSGVVVAVLIGLPAARFAGMQLAVITLAFNYMMWSYVMNPHYWIGAHLMPTGFAAQINRPNLWQRISLGDIGPNRNYYFLCLVCLGLAMAAASSFRRFHSGRVLIALRDNQRAAASFAINVVRSRVAAFAVAGGIAGLAGVLLMYAQGNVIPDSFAPQYSIIIFLAVVVGGANSLPWAVSGAVVFEAFTLFGPKLLNPVLGPDVTSALPLILAGPGLIITLLQYPSGNAEWGYQLRDRFLRRVAARHDILVPSLVADRRVEADQARDAISAAEQQFTRAHPNGAAGSGLSSAPDGTGGRTITCPVCFSEFSLSEAADHEHLRPASARGASRTPEPVE
ncbi:MAG TPA: ABC transporter permease [Acidimicrobiales bacterium]|nr:ABC transporter permease [Acidimicrobiales bacterium]